MSKAKHDDEKEKKSTFEKLDDAKDTVKSKFTGGNTNIREVNTVGREHRIVSVVTEDGNQIDYKDFHKNINKYTVANLDKKEEPFALIEQGGKIRFKDKDADLVGFAGVKENWNPNINPEIPA